MSLSGVYVGHSSFSIDDSTAIPGHTYFELWFSLLQRWSYCSIYFVSLTICPNVSNYVMRALIYNKNLLSYCSYF